MPCSDMMDIKDHGGGQVVHNITMEARTDMMTNKDHDGAPDTNTMNNKNQGRDNFSNVMNNKDRRPGTKHRAKDLIKSGLATTTNQGTRSQFSTQDHGESPETTC
jgi:hypothetical protein